MIEGQDLPEHLKLKSAVFAMSLLPKERGGGRFLNLGDIGKRNVVISTKIARDYPNADGTPKKVGQTLRIGNEVFTIVGLYETGSLVTDVTIVMEIGVARKLLGVAEATVSTFDVEPARDRRDRRAGRADRGRVAGGPRPADQPVQPRRSARSWESSICSCSWRSAWRSWSVAWGSPIRC